MLDRSTAVLLSALPSAPSLVLEQPSNQASVSASQRVAATPSSASIDAMSSASPLPLPSAHSFLDNLSRHWTEADSTKQTFMAILLVVQLVLLFRFIKGSLDKLFGRRAGFRNKRTKRFARRAAIAAAGGSSKSSIPLSHQRPLYRTDSKPQLPPRPSLNHPLLRPHPSAPQSALQTTPTGDIILPSWTESGPTPLKVIIEDPEGESSLGNSPSSSRSHSPLSYRDSLHPSVVSVHQETPHYSWPFRATSPGDNTSLRLRERNDYNMLPFTIDRSSTPDTRLEDVKRPFNRPNYYDDRASHFSPPSASLPLPSTMPSPPSPSLA